MFDRYFWWDFLDVLKFIGFYLMVCLGVGIAIFGSVLVGVANLPFLIPVTALVGIFIIAFTLALADRLV